MTVSFVVYDENQGGKMTKWNSFKRKEGKNTQRAKWILNYQFDLR